jgi:hypothetical protein
MTTAHLMDRLLDCFGSEPEARERVHRQSTYYVAIAELGYELFSTLRQEPETPWCRQFLEVLEGALQGGDPETRNLIAVGLFESLQSQSYRLGPPDLLESRLGPLSLGVWSDLMEGWCGGGIRRVADWRASSKD